MNFYQGVIKGAQNQLQHEEWEETAKQVKIRKANLDETFPVVDVKRNAKSAKSHIFRRDKVEAE